MALTEWMRGGLAVIAAVLLAGPAAMPARGDETTPNAPTEETPEPPDESPEPEPEPDTGDPVGTISGIVYDSATDVRVSCPDIDLVLRRAYGSWSIRDGALGHGWSHAYEWRLFESGDGTVKVYADADPEAGGGGKVHSFAATNASERAYDAAGYSFARLADGTRAVTSPAGTAYSFDGVGRLAAVSSWNGTRVSIERDATAGRVVRAVHDCGAALGFEYDGDGLLVRVTTPDPAAWVEYSYANRVLVSSDAQGNGGAAAVASAKRSLASAVRRDGPRAATNLYEYVVPPEAGVRLPRAVSERHPDVAARLAVDWIRPASPSTMAANAALDARRPVLASKTDANGVGTVYGYVRDDDAQSVRCAWTSMSGGLFEASLRFLRGETVELRPYAGGTAETRLRYDERERETERRTGSETRTLVYHESGDVAWEKVVNADTRASLVSAFVYDGRHRVTAFRRTFGDVPGPVARYEWDDFFGIPRRTVSPAGRVREWATNGFDVVVRGAEANDPRLVTTVHCSTNWRPMSAELPDGGRVLWERDDAGRVVRVARDGQPDARYSYDALGRVAAETRPGPDGPRATSYVRNARGRPLSVVRPDGTSEAFAYDGAGTRAVAHVDALGRTDVFEWGLGLPVHAGRVGADGATNRLWSVAHDPQLNVVSVTDPLGRRAETYVLDANERVVAATNLEGQALLRSYLVGDLVAAETRFDGTEVSYGYDSGGRLASADYPDAEVRLAWDADGLLLSASDVAGTVTNVRDAATGWLVLSRGVDGTDVRYAHSDGGAATSVVSAAGTTAHTLDAAGRRTRSASPAGTVSFARCPWSGLVSTATNANGLAAAFSRDAMERVTNVAWTAADGSPLGGMSCVRDALGRVVSRRVRMGDAVFDRAFAYDGLDRLAADGPMSYEYDAAGNRLSARGGAEGDVAYEYAPGDRLSSWTGGSCEWDAAGCATRIAHAGRPVLGLVWDGRRRLVSVSTNGVPAESYSYDALGRRVSTTTAEGTVRHVYDDRWQCVADLAGDGAVLRSYLWDEGVDRLLAVRAGGLEYAALTDAQGTVWGFSDGTDVVARWTYDAWGNVLSEEIAPSASALAGTRHRFHGRELSAATGLVHFRARWYDPLVGRWISKDPIRLHGGLNLYAFCADDPVNWIDPFGEAQVGSRSLNWPGNLLEPFAWIPGASLIMRLTNTFPEHQHIFYEDGKNIGWGGKGYMCKEDSSQYTFKRRKYRDEIIRKAVINVKKDWLTERWWGHGYHGLFHNCQDFVDAVLEEYERLCR